MPMDHSIQLAEMEAGPLKDLSLLLANFNTPSGRRYLITNKLNIGNVPQLLFLECKWK